MGLAQPRGEPQEPMIAFLMELYSADSNVERLRLKPEERAARQRIGHQWARKREPAREKLGRGRLDLGPRLFAHRLGVPAIWLGVVDGDADVLLQAALHVDDEAVSAAYSSEMSAEPGTPRAGVPLCGEGKHGPGTWPLHWSATRPAVPQPTEHIAERVQPRMACGVLPHKEQDRGHSTGRVSHRRDRTPGPWSDATKPMTRERPSFAWEAGRFPYKD